MNKKLWIETDYFSQFKCKADKCKRCCCSGWVIPVSKKEYYKLLTLDCSKQLADKIESCFVSPDFPTEERYRIISPNYLGNCPMLDENGLCMIHKELGPEALAQVCNSYPRSLKKVNNIYQANCSNSCEAVVELLLSKDKLTFKAVESNDSPNIYVNTNEDLTSVAMYFTQIIQDRALPLNKRIGKIVHYLNNNDIDNNDSLFGFKQVLNFVTTVSVNSQIYDEFKEKLLSSYTLDEDGLNKYKQDELEFENNYPNWMIYFENIIINHLYYMDIPYVDSRINPKDCTEGLCLGYGLMKLICSCMTKQDHSLENLVYVISDIFHLVEHTPFYYNAHILIKDETSLLNI